VRFEFDLRARAEFREAVLYYEEQQPGLGDRFTSAVYETIQHLLEFPQVGSPTGSGLRRVWVRRFPFVLIYAVGDDVIRVMVLAHAQRRPDYWRSRLTE
jgi:plasmid stabilization system protein ParE